MAERGEEGGQTCSRQESCHITDEARVRCKGREFNPERDSVGLFCSEGGTVGGGNRKGDSRGQSPDEHVRIRADRL